MDLTAIYKRSVIYPVIILLPVVAIYATIEARNHKGEWLRGEDFIIPTIFVALVYGLAICVLALSIFLNRFEKVSSNITLSALSWFLLPGGFIYVMLRLAYHQYKTIGLDYEIAYPIILNLPFIAGLVWGFWKFNTTQH